MISKVCQCSLLFVQKKPFSLKKIFLPIVAFLALAHSLQAQPILIGLNNNQNTGLASVIRWDAATGTMLDSVVTTQQGSVMGSSAFDAVHQKYYFDGSVKICRVGFNPASFDELMSSGITSGTEIDMANGKIFSVRSVAVLDSLGAYIGSQCEFMRYNILDSTEIVLGVFPSILGFYLDINCYNSNTGTYYFLGVDTLGASTLVSIPTRSTSFNPTLIALSNPNANIFTLEYDNDNDILYALSDNGTLTWHLQIQQIDTLTGALTLEADFPQLIGYLMTTTTYDQANHSMIMVAIDTNQNYTLFSYNTSANMLSTLLSPYPGEFAELECDNAIYAQAKYGQVTDVKAPEEVAALLLYPNPAHDVLRFAIAQTIAETHILDAMGRSIPVSWANGSNALDVEKLAMGWYALRLKLADGSWVQGKFLKQ